MEKRQAARVLLPMFALVGITAWSIVLVSPSVSASAVPEASSSSASNPPSTGSGNAIAQCIALIAAGDDAEARAKCAGVPNPTEAQVTETKTCLAAIDVTTKGDAAAYSAEVARCMNAYAGNAKVPAVSPAQLSSPQTLSQAVAYCTALYDQGANTQADELCGGKTMAAMDLPLLAGCDGVVNPFATDDAYKYALDLEHCEENAIHEPY